MLAVAACAGSVATLSARAGDDPRTESVVGVLPLGHPDQRNVELVEAALKRTYRFKVVELKGVPLPDSAYYAPRHRYRAEKLIAFEQKWPTWKVIGVTDRDISTTLYKSKDFGIMGFGYIGGRSCVVSSHRPHERVGIIAIHEIGHTLGLPHCPNPKCVMRDGEGKGLVAKTTGKFCAVCASKIRQWLR
ncbi:MAG: hypothetical protein P4L46_22010 [Fimbriimonas sp.]|nr:hypothetical protein [Fimbriimonas sp.]